MVRPVHNRHSRVGMPKVLAESQAAESGAKDDDVSFRSLHCLGVSSLGAENAILTGLSEELGCVCVGS